MKPLSVSTYAEAMSKYHRIYIQIYIYICIDIKVYILIYTHPLTYDNIAAR
jgi:hypothetical protein